jgi:coenzyme PQQ precursor peptide PqqA
MLEADHQRVRFRQSAGRRLSQLLYPEVAEAGRPIPHGRNHQKNPLMRHWFDGNSVPALENIVQCNIFTADAKRQKIPLANFLIRTSLSGGRSSSGFTLRRAKMAWKAPKIVEVPVGMEINMYACAARK